jgi:hypothetical protein
MKERYLFILKVFIVYRYNTGMYGTVRYHIVMLPGTRYLYILIQLQYWYILVLGDGHIANVVGHTPVFELVEYGPPVLFHRAKDSNVQWLSQMRGVWREEDEPNQTKGQEKLTGTVQYGIFFKDVEL